MKRLPGSCLIAALGILAGTGSVQAQLFNNLKSLSNRIRVGNPRTDAAGDFLNENPKGLIAADIDGDGKADWAVSRLDGAIVIAYGKGDGKFDSLEAVVSPAGAFRQLIAADLNGDGRLDLASADPAQGKVYLFLNEGDRSFAAPAALVTWEGARNLVAGDFDGDGVIDLVVAGPDKDVTANFENPWDLSPLNPPSPVPQPRTGVVQYRGLGGGSFERMANVDTLAVASKAPRDEDDSFPRPVYVLKAWRPAGQSKDWLVATHALATRIWVLAAGEDHRLAVRSEFPTGIDGVRSLALGPVVEPKTSARLDLILASRDLGTVEVHRSTADGLGFEAAAAQQLDMPGGPRALELADLNADGMNELIVVARNLNKVRTFKNVGGQLGEATDATTGTSPRELAAADFNGDGRIDFAVLNRRSSNVSVLTAADDSGPGGAPRTGFAALDQVYQVDGDVAQLGIYDLDGDGRADVLQLHRASAEVSIRMAGVGGKLGEPSFYKMGTRPSGMSVADINKDGRADIVVAALGGSDGGSVVVRLGDGTGAFGPPQSFRPPPEPPVAPPPVAGSGINDPSLPPGATGALPYGALYAVLPVDLDGDGKLDLAAGYYDCRIVFFKGDGQGRFSLTEGVSDHELYSEFGYEARFIVAGDFDQDGDMDLAAAAWPGDVVVLENTGNFFLTDRTRPAYKRHFFPRYNNKMAQARDIVAEDVNGDGDLDLIVGTGAGTQILLGKPGMAFERKMYPRSNGGGENSLPVVPTTEFAVSAVATGDFDDQAGEEMAVICERDSCLTILKQDDDDQWQPVLIVEAPETAYLATGDIDGDGKADLVGTGSTLWVSLSSRPTSSASPSNAVVKRPTLPHVVINEILPRNSAVPVPDPLNRLLSAGTVEAVELYNGSASDVTLDGMKLQLTEADGTKKAFAFPPGRTLPAGGRQIVLCSKNTGNSPWTTGFRLPKEGATLSLHGNESAIDEVTYPVLADNESYARFADGDAAFHVNCFPDIGRPNLDNGAVEPSASLAGVSLATLAPGNSVRFYAKAKDDVGIVGLVLWWRARGEAGAEFEKALLYDDGINGDGGRLDGVFSGLLGAGLPAGTEIECYLEAEDLSGAKKYIPGQPAEFADEISGELYTLAIPSTEPAIPGIEISEAVADNLSGLTDERGKAEDWIELRNTGNQPIPLDGIALADSLFSGAPRFLFADGQVLPPKSHWVIFCDSDLPTGTTLHAPFKLSASEGDEIQLVRYNARGTQEIVDFIQIPMMSPDVAWARVGAGGSFRAMPPTPGIGNLKPGQWLTWTEKSGGVMYFNLAYPTQAGITPMLESCSDLAAGHWVPLATNPGDGLERLRVESVDGAKFFRLQP